MGLRERSGRMNGDNIGIAADPPAQPCLRSGLCCRKGPCAFGERTSSTEPCCKFLEEERTLENGAVIHRCGIYEKIIALPKPEWFWNPAFGGGCCMPLFNENRQRIKESQRDGG